MFSILVSAAQCLAFLVSAAICLAFLIPAVQVFCNLCIILIVPGAQCLHPT